MSKMRNLLIAGMAILPLSALADSKANVTGSSLKVIEIAPEASTGLNNIFVVFDSKGCTLNFKVSNGYTAGVYRFSNLGGAYAEEITNADRQAGSIAVALSGDDMGYILEDGNTKYYCWVVNYANHKMTVSSLSPSADQECDFTKLDFAGSAEPINYTTINGQQRVLNREITITYTTQTFDSESSIFTDETVEKTFESLGNPVLVSPPAYCSTYFTLAGDRFLKEWGMELHAESGIMQPVAVNCHTEAVQEETGGDEGSNIMGGDSNGLGGSAPSEIHFLSYTTEAVVHYEWQMGRDPEFRYPEYRFYQRDLDYTFNEEGTFYLRFIGSNAEGTCETTGDTFTVSIGASALEVPNAFSPNGDGINDVWKVSYRSLLDFHCEIFNRNGQRIYGFDDPAGGWDGTWHGKLVAPGVYYYVITATGADGQTYKKSGDINIIKATGNIRTFKE